MIYGIGTDLVDLDRIKIKSLSAFARKILGNQELKKYQQLTDGLNQSYIGKQFAGKEAFAKALSTGFKKANLSKGYSNFKKFLWSARGIII